MYLSSLPQVFDFESFLRIKQRISSSRQMQQSLLWMINSILNHQWQYWNGRSRDSSVGTSTRLRATQLKNRGATLSRSRGFYLWSLLTGYGAQAASCSTGTGCSYSWVTRPGHEIDHSTLSSAEVKNGGSYAATPPPLCLHGQNRVNLRFNGFLPEGKAAGAQHSPPPSA